MDVAALVVIVVAVAVGVLQRFGRVEELDAQLLAHGQQRHIEVVDPGLVHVGVVGVVGRDRRHRVDDDIGIGIAGLNGLYQRGVVADKVLGFMPLSLVPSMMTTRRGFILATACAMV